eukprot:6202244-Pleurochrysis_carterae.AAC.1
MGRSKRRCGGWGASGRWFKEWGSLDSGSNRGHGVSRTWKAEREALQKYTYDASPIWGTVHVSVKLQMKGARDDRCTVGHARGSKW